MSDSGELRKLVKQLQNASAEQDILGILRILKKEYHVNEAILRESKAGLAVGKLRANASKPVSDLAKELVKKWKNDVERAKNQSTGSSSNGKGVSRNGSAIVTIPSASAKKSETRNARSDGIKIDMTGDKTRDKCIELIYDGLSSNSGAPSDLILTRAKAVEKSVHSNHGGTTSEYRAKIRSLFVNLKDKNNPSLREGIVSGDLSAEKFASMSSAEMASEDRKAADSAIEAQNLFNSLGAEEQQAETDAFQCGRCKQRKCRYRQAQTRSADEPMTTFVTCTNCNNRWKFS